MNITEFTFRLILIFIPGLISFRILHILTGRDPVKVHFALIDSLILGFLNYAVFYLVSRIHVLRLDFTLTEVLVDGSAPLGFMEILTTTALSIPMGFFAAFVVDRRIIYGVSSRLGATKNIAGKDVWSYALRINESKWVVVRDVEWDLIFEGWLQAVSDKDEDDEIMLRDVAIFRNSTGEPLYQVPGVYLSRKKDVLIIEFPKLEFTNYITRPVE